MLVFLKATAVLSADSVDRTGTVMAVDALIVDAVLAQRAGIETGDELDR